MIGIGSSVPYAASKGAMITLTLSLARALAPKIRVNAVCPGFIDTPWFAKSMPPERLERMRAGVAAAMPLKSASTADDIAGAAVFFASPAARHVTGETLMVDAGLRLRPARHAVDPAPLAERFARVYRRSVVTLRAAACF